METQLLSFIPRNSQYLHPPTSGLEYFRWLKTII